MGAYIRAHARACSFNAASAETRDRTGDLQSFSLTLSQLSYRGYVLNAMPKLSPNNNYAHLVDQMQTTLQLTLPPHYKVPLCVILLPTFRLAYCKCTSA